MSGDLPEASGSASTPPAQHLVSLVIDSTLTKDQYLKLVEANGVVHSLIQRLMEKHGGDAHLLLNSRVIPLKGRDDTHNPIIRSANALGFRRFSTFLATLPGLAKCLTPADDAEVAWPSFLGKDTTAGQASSWQSAKTSQRGRETSLLNGIVEGLELLTHSRTGETVMPRILHSMSPSDAEPLMNSLFGDASSTHGSRYIIVLTGTPPVHPTRSLGGSDNTQDQWIATPTINWDSAWDGKSWRDIGTACRARGISASCVIAGGEDSDSEVSRNLRKLCQETSPNGFEDAWFDVPRDVDVAISGFGLDPGTVPPSPTVGASTAPTDQIVTPAIVPEPVPVNPASANNAKSQYSQQQLRALQAVANKSAASGNPLNAQTMQQLMAAMKAGNLDNNAPAVQQIKSFIMMQQQKKQTQGGPQVPGQGVPGNVTQAQAPPQATAASGQGTDQILLAAMRQQMLQQNQNQGQGGIGNNVVPPTQQQAQQPQQQIKPPVQQQQTQARQNQQPAPQQQQQNTNNGQNQVRGTGQRIWSGDLCWTPPNSNTRFVVSLDGAAVHSNSPNNYHAQYWPKDLIISEVTAFSLQELQTLAKQYGAPFICFSPQVGPEGPDQGNMMRYTNMTTSLSRASQIATVKFAENKGLAVFAPPSTDGRTPRLMALVCVNCPLPQGRPNQSSNTNSNPQTTPSQGMANLAPNPSPVNKMPTPQQQQATVSPSFMLQQQQQQQQQAQYMPKPNPPQQQFTQQQAQQLAAAAQQHQQQQQMQQQPMQYQPPPQPQQVQQQLQPSGQPQRMLTPEQTQAFRDLARKANLDLGPWDPFNLDEAKYRQILKVLSQQQQNRPNQAQAQQLQPQPQPQQHFNQQAQQQQLLQQAQQQQQMNMGQMGNFQFNPQQYLNNNGQNGFQGMNMGMAQGYQQ